MSVSVKTLYVRESDLVGRREVTPDEAARNRAAGKYPRSPRPGKPGVLPFSASTLWRLVANKAFPAPSKLSGRVTVWRWADVEAWQRDVAGH